MAGEGTDGTGDNAVDTELYSRQLYVMGAAAQQALTQSDVLVVGLNGVGVEVAKNVILAGVRSVTLFDPQPPTHADLSSQFFLREEDLASGRGRAELCVERLAELNPYVQVSARGGDGEELSEELVENYNVVVLIDVSHEMQARINDFARARGIKFISADVRGVFATAFCDFGDEFVVSDTTGEPAAASMVASITQSNPGLVTVLEDAKHGLASGDVISLTDLHGMEELNGREFTVQVKDSYSFTLDVDTTNMTAHVRGGYVNQIKQGQVVTFRSFRDELADPQAGFVGDFSQMMAWGPLHQAFRALDAFRTENGGRMPRPGNSSDAQAVFERAVAINDAAAPPPAGDDAGEGNDKGNAPTGFYVEGLAEQEKLIKQLALTAAGTLNPMCAIMGGVVGQEVLKACSGKFMPNRQFFYFHAAEALPDEPLPEEQVQPAESRYDGQIMVFGREMQDRIGDLNYFLVGAGAIGCEMLKNWSLMGVACGNNGMVHVTDMDRIERSNLSRQFLFRSGDIDAPKSSTAARAAVTMNPNLHIHAHETRVAPDTEDIFDDDFFEGLNGVCTALDNVEARLYVDQRCVFYHLPMLESGTLGTKGNTQVVIPHKTEHYGATRDPPEKGIPICTLKHFPNKIEHTLQWAREWFEGVFKQTPDDVQSYLSMSPEEFSQTLASQQNMKLDTLQRVRGALVDHKPRGIEDCITWARLQFQSMFHNDIRQLLHIFPLDKHTSKGEPFWSGAKKPPTALEFDIDDPVHMDFVASSARLYARTFGVAVPENLEEICRAHVPTVEVPPFVPRDGVKIATTEAEAKEQQSGSDNAPASSSSSASSAIGPADVDAQCAAMQESLPSVADLGGLTMQPIDFDKDIDDHMRVVAACGNLRARNYRIPESDLHAARGIAGKIIPAIATTTALVTGLVCLELYKVLQEKPLEAFRNTFLNLAIPVFSSAEPNPPEPNVAKLRSGDWQWTQWDAVDVEDSTMTLRGLQRYMQERFNANVSMLSYGVSILFSDFMSKKKVKSRLDTQLRELAVTVSKRPLPESQKYLILEVICNDRETDDEIELPYLRLKLR